MWTLLTPQPSPAPLLPLSPHPLVLLVLGKDQLTESRNTLPYVEAICHLHSDVDLLLKGTISLLNGNHPAIDGRRVVEPQ